MKSLLSTFGAFLLGFLIASITFQDDSVLEVSEVNPSQPKLQKQDPVPPSTDPSGKESQVNGFNSQHNDNWSQFIDHLITLVPKTDSFNAAWKKIHSLSLPEKRLFLLAALDHRKRGQVKGLISNLMYTLAKEDMPRAQKMFEDMRPQDRAHFGVTFLYGWAHGDSKGAWDWLNSVDRSTVGSFLRTDTILQIKRAAIIGMMNDPNRSVDVLDLVLNETDIIFAEQSLDTVVHQMVEKDIVKTLGLIDTYPEISETIVKKAIEYWAKSDLSQATNYLMSNEDIASAQSAAFIGEMMILNDASENTPQLYSELDRPELKEQLALVAAGHSAQHNLHEAIIWMDSIENRRTKRQAAANVIHKLGFSDNMDTHIQFLETTLGTTADARPVYVRSLREWKKTTPDRVNEYVDSLPTNASDLREQLIWQLNLDLGPKD